MKPYITVTLVFILAACGSGAPTQPPVLGDSVMDPGSVADAAGPDAHAQARDSGTGNPSLGDGSQQTLDGSTPEADPPAEAGTEAGAADTGVADAPPEADPMDAAMEAATEAATPDAAPDAADPPDAGADVAVACVPGFTGMSAPGGCMSSSDCCTGSICEGPAGPPSCLISCNTNSDCPSPLTCINEGTYSVCL